MYICLCALKYGCRFSCRFHLSGMTEQMKLKSESEIPLNYFHRHFTE